MLYERAADGNYIAAMQAGALLSGRQDRVASQVNQAMSVLAPTAPNASTGVQHIYPTEIEETLDSLVQL